MGATPDEEKELLKHLGIDESEIYAQELDRKNLHPAIAVGLGIFGILNIGLLLSLPPVLLGRGAPYLPTSRKRMDVMFKPLHLYFSQHPTNSLRFADLGIGDGTVVFRAAREGLFYKSVGYEINPLLHLWVHTWRIIQAPKYWSSTNFYHGDLWKADMSNYHVVAVYGLSPIMKDLGVKLKSELKPGSVVISNVFDIPSWKPSNMSREGVHIYITPDCWESDVDPNEM